MFHIFTKHTITLVFLSSFFLRVLTPERLLFTYIAVCLKHHVHIHTSLVSAVVIGQTLVVLIK